LAVVNNFSKDFSKDFSEDLHDIYCFSVANLQLANLQLADLGERVTVLPEGRFCQRNGLETILEKTILEKT
jgi:hypothetical protein